MTNKKQTPNRKLEISKQESIMLFESLPDYMKKLHCLDLDKARYSSFGRELAEVAIRKESEIKNLMDKVFSESDIKKLNEIESQTDKMLDDSLFDQLPF